MPAGPVCALFFAAATAAQDPATPEPPRADEAIIVTGERVSRSLRETPSSVEVFTADVIETRPGVDRLDQLLELVPNVTLGPSNLGPAIRGQDTTGALQDLPAFLGGNRPRATLQIDGRAVGHNEFVFGVSPVWDVERIEVFRSPQTTTQGRNSIAGAIFVETKDPTYGWEAGGRAIAGNLDARQLSGVVSGPLIADQVAVRIAGDLRRGRTSTRITDRMPGANPNDDNFGLIRFKALAEPQGLPGARLEVTYTHSESASNRPGLVRAPFHERRDPFPVYGVLSTNVDAVTGSLALDLSDGLSSVTTVSFGDGHIKRFPPPGLGRTNTDTIDLSVESIAHWKPDGPVRMVGGIHYLRQRLVQFIDLTAVIGVGEFDDHQRSLGLFGEATFQATPRLSITGGLRYQRDSQRRIGQLGTTEFLLPIDFDETFESWLPKVSVAFEFSDELTAGILIQRAYNPGGITLNFDTGEEDLFGPEKLWSYEAFARALMADGRLRLSANIFYNDFRHAQRSTFHAFSVPGGGTAFWAELDNVRRAETYGLEAALDWGLTDRLRARLGLGLLKTRIVEPADNNPSLKGNDFSRAPPWTASGSFDWQPLNRFRLTASVRHAGRYFSDDANSLHRKIGRATRIDARAAYDFGPVTIFGYGRNLLDDFNMIFLNSTALGVAMDPREVGLGIESRF